MLIVVIFKVTYHFEAAIWGIKKLVVLELKRENVKKKYGSDFDAAIIEESLTTHCFFLSQRFE